MSTNPRTFTHTYRPAVTPALNPRRRLYGIESPYMPGGWVGSITERVGDMVVAAEVKREAKADLSDLMITTGFSQADGAPIEGPGYSTTTIRMSPRSLRELARALLDAADDIENNPARTLLANDTSKAAA